MNSLDGGDATHASLGTSRIDFYARLAVDTGGNCDPSGAVRGLDLYRLVPGTSSRDDLEHRHSWAKREWLVAADVLDSAVGRLRLLHLAGQFFPQYRSLAQQRILDPRRDVTRGDVKSRGKVMKLSEEGGLVSADDYERHT